MKASEDSIIGQRALEEGLVRPADLERCRKLQEDALRGGATIPALRQVLVDQGLLTPAQVGQLMKAAVLAAEQLPAKIGPYEIEGKLGQGGMGAVLKARLKDTNIRVALKVLPADLVSDRERLARFHREAKLGQQLVHPHVVRTMDYGEDGGVHYITLELIEGGDLSVRLRKTGRMGEREALEVVRDVAKALQGAHRLGLVHRDVKPANVMFDRAGTVKLSDFGLVKGADPEASFLTQTGMAMGTPHYLAPEQARNAKNIDIRADIYALGATLYHLVTGKTPYDGQTAYEVVLKHATDELTPPTRVHAKISRGCEYVILRMMAKDPESRYADPDELLEDIDRVLRGEAPAKLAAETLAEKKVVTSALPRAKSDPAGMQSAPPGLSDTYAPRARGNAPRKPEPRHHRPAWMLWAGGAAGALLALLLLWALWPSRSAPGVQDPHAPKQAAPAEKTEAPAAPAAKTGAPAVSETRPTAPATAQDWRNLLPSVDPRGHGVEGQWRKRNNELYSDSHPNARIKLGDPAGAEYDYEVEFTVLPQDQQDGPDFGRGEVCLIFRKGPYHARFALWCRDYRTIGIIWDDQLFWGTENPTYIYRQEDIPQGRRMVARVEVRNSEVRGYLDQRLLCTWHVNAQDHRPAMEIFSLGDRSKIGVGTHQTKVIVHRAAVRRHTP
ncbi:MAG: hypothetical protein AMXMBFR7_10280 [Planctomycetota bacterium]